MPGYYNKPKYRSSNDCWMQCSSLHDGESREKVRSHKHVRIHSHRLYYVTLGLTQGTSHDQCRTRTTRTQQELLAASRTRVEDILSAWNFATVLL
ncbi:hypothetical protein BT96DRAFT_567530 [Gymnopus androsaceus JB14]|uniref:Uncharacterized protein n=1 Tax=Gymnopus androsaceus JB14 TaxID=1447944 RepID=A0A6A4GDS0_9AGAR|nr:hypothetical protein BT96DRAFT_723011 [Gymnopus androsaceus JB14]KAE9385792.1 hypothetical protein BT96DRAFT_567530 [Gymnopus androsaceus JB14]